MTRRDLDQLLRRWAERHRCDEAHAQQLADRIAQAAPRPLPEGLGNGTDERPVARERLAYAAMGAAAALLLAGGLWLAVGQRPRPKGTDGARQAAAISEAEVQANARLFREIQRLFADDLRWVVHTDRDVRLNVAPAAGRPAAHATPILVRVVVLSRTAQQRTWRKLLATDVLAPSEELVQTTPDPATGNQLALWAYPLPDGKVAVDSRIRLSTPILASADLSTVATPGEPVQVLALESEGTEYRVFEIVIPLPKPRGA